MDPTIIKEALIVLGTPIVRSAAGWLEKSLEDRKITRFELRKLFQTTVRVGIIALSQLCIAKGFKVEVGFVEVLALSGSTILTDKLFGALKDNNNVTKR